MIRRISFSEHEFYHVYNRGTDKRTIYQSPADYQRFLELLFLANSSESFNVRDLREKYKEVYDHDRGDQLVAIGAYCLMPNHFHLLVTPLVDQGLTKFMGKLMTGYSMYFNKKYDRTGALFEGRFKAKHADSDEYLKYLFSYIHLNPIKLQSDSIQEGLSLSDKSFTFVKDFEYSSLSSYFGQTASKNVILQREAFPDYFGNMKNLKSELYSWLDFDLSPRAGLGES